MWPFAKKPAPEPSRRAQRIAPTSVKRPPPAPRDVAANDGFDARSAREVEELSRGGRLVSQQRANELEDIATFADVPRFHRILSAGDQPIVEVPVDRRDRLVVIDSGGRNAVVIHAGVDAALLNSIVGSLRERNYSSSVARAASEVIRQIQQSRIKNEARGMARQQTPYVAAMHEWISYAVENRATDIHLEVRGSAGYVRFRIDGEMEPMRGDKQGKEEATFIEKCMSSLFNNEQAAKSGSDSMFERDQNLYCMVPYDEIPGHTLRLRFQSLKGNEGPKTVLRLLHVDENLPTLTFEQAGYEPSMVELWRQAMHTPSGAVLIAGVTGSGKSTTLKSFIELNPNTPSSNVLTVEDPVEYPIRGAHQVPIQRDLANPQESAKRFSEVISAFMRSDPDVVMVGEIRDRFSSNAAQQLAETGHMALGTVHAHLLSGIVPRLVNTEIGMSRAILTAPNMLTLLAYQALVPKLCKHCCLPASEVQSDRQVAMIVQILQQLNLPLERMRWKNPSGCSHCNGRGTAGLTVVAEMLMPDEEWLSPIRDGLDAKAVEVYRSRSDGDLTSPNMNGKTVFEHCLYKALNGLVDARNCSDFDTWPRFSRHHSHRRA